MKIKMWFLLLMLTSFSSFAMTDVISENELIGCGGMNYGIEGNRTDEGFVSAMFSYSKKENSFVVSLGDGYDSTNEFKCEKSGRDTLKCSGGNWFTDREGEEEVISVILEVARFYRGETSYAARISRRSSLTHSSVTKNIVLPFCSVRSRSLK